MSRTQRPDGVGGPVEHRRPSGAPPPFPRDPAWTRWLWAAAAVVALGVLLRTVINPHDVESAFLRTLQDARTSFLTDVAKALNWFALPAVVLALRIATVV